MKKIGVFICNYNKKEYVLNNLASMFQQTIMDDIDIYVIDNASSDGSADAIEKNYPLVHVMRNQENIGGAGGFYQALKMGEEHGYPYILLADNDIRLAPDAIEQLYVFLKEHEDVGMVGSKVYLMDDPSRIWIYGNYIDFDNYKMIDCYANELEDESQPDIVYCDTVPSCCLLIKTECLKKTGYMPKENFIFWDDIEWCHRFGLAGYKVAAIAASKVWHKTGGSVLTTHFGTYYYNRNRLHFFAKYIKEEKIEDYVETLLEDFFRRIYGLAQKGSVNAVTALMYALHDFLMGVRGKADAYKILPYDSFMNPLKDINDRKKPLIIDVDCEEADKAGKSYYNALHNVLWNLKNVNDVFVKLNGTLENIQSFETCYQNMYGDVYDKVTEISLDVTSIRICEHVRSLDEYTDGSIWVDEWCNIIIDRKDFYYFQNYEFAKRNFMMMYHDLFIQAIYKIRNGR